MQMARKHSMPDSVDLLATAKSVGSLVRRASVEKRKLSEGFIKAPLGYGYAIPVSSSSGEEVLWKTVKPKETFKLLMPANTRLEFDRCADIQTIRNLVSKEESKSKLNGKKKMKEKKLALCTQISEVKIWEPEANSMERV
ncbi:hypothetical protein R1flu_010625 [Riccia fluitans]|uniref:Uncharacterized protein n=1 Tax=Riccia fluitans TaxID=41844 RepID=A0ABD1Z6F2_9MARC